MTLSRALPLAALLASLLSAGCGSDSNLRDRGQCDGVLNTVEQTVDDGFDVDGDGYFDALSLACQETYPPEQLDCDDEDPDVNPGMAEEACNDIDDDCDEATVDAPDQDNDGYTPCEGDCDDAQPTVGPDQDELICDGLDNDCDSATADGPDEDGDGYACDDCDDADPDVNPATTEVVCNGADDDCNELTPDGDDFDNDGFVHCFDCDDADPLRYPGAVDICEDGIDQDCDTIDPDCPPPTWDGLWATSPTVVYSCASNSVAINFSSVSVIDNSPQISFTSVGGGQPGTMTGTLGAGDSFNASYSIAGLCTENYSLVGSFTSGTTFSATFTAQFVDASGTGFGCIDCTDQTFSITGTR